MAVKMNKGTGSSDEKINQEPGVEQKAIPSFMRRGAAAKDALAHEEKKAEERKNRQFDFYLKVGEEAVITFLDGPIVEGTLDCPFWYEHLVETNGQMESVVCIKETEPCPVCQSGNYSVLVGGLSVNVHTPYVNSKKETIAFYRRVFKFKRQSYGILNKYALMYKGLAGCSFEVGRHGGDRSPRIGDTFVFLNKTTLPEFGAQYKLKQEQFTEIEPENMAIYRTSQELSMYGPAPIGSPHGGTPGLNKGSGNKYAGRM